MSWIKTKKKLPKNREIVLGLDLTGLPRVCWLHNGEWFCPGFNMTPVWWTPIPDPPQELKDIESAGRHIE